MSLKAMALAVSGAFLLFCGMAAPVGGRNDKSFEADVLPIFKAHCLTCHSGGGAAANLDLSSAAGLEKGGDSGAAFVAGDSAKSLIVQRMLGEGGLTQMPKGFAPLSAAKIATVREWIDQGAKFGGAAKKHWAYDAPQRPPVPPVKDKAWVRNPIDAFVLSKLESKGWAPSPEAEKGPLLRRVSLDLTGLPPTPEEVAAFVKDRRPDAYERAVDRLLKSVHYGERMGRPWLDLARYADSDGYEADANRVAWPYRDWVIKAFNANKPFDQFTIEQLAGDLLPGATLEQRVATGFHRNSMFNREGGVDPGEARYVMVMDRVDTTATVWMGSTLACAKCHDHKYDPFTQKDYFASYALFANTEYSKEGDFNVGQEKWTEPTLPVPTAEQQRAIQKLEEAIQRAEDAIKTAVQKAEPDFQAWIKAPNKGVWDLPLVEASSSSGAPIERLIDGSLVIGGPAQATDSYTVRLSGVRTIGSIRLEALPQNGLVGNGPGKSSSGNFILTGLQVALNGLPVEVGSIEASYTQGGYDPALLLKGEAENGWAVYPRQGKTSELVIGLKSPVRPGTDAAMELRLTFGSKQWPQHVLGRFRVSTSAAIGLKPLPAKVADILSKPDRTPEDDKALREAFAANSGKTKEMAKRLEQSRAELTRIKSEIPVALVLSERPASAPLTAPLHRRGEYLSPGTPVAASAPGFLPPLPKATPANRLSFARWLVSRDNPLTARVQVNRLWEVVFGRGLVETSEDFGTQGAPPSHSELLDWLAVEFMDSGWDVKRMMKLIVTSATYRQNAATSAARLKEDPQNVWLSRGARFRMEAEMVRDNALAIAGLLSRKVGGPSVYPAQPAGVWDTPYNGQQWMTSQGEDRYRRGLYTFWKRSSTYPAFMAMDATSRETCTARRLRTNTPLQALNLLNDEAMMEAARGLAVKMAKAGRTERDRLVYGFVACTSRIPSAQETERLTALYKQVSERFRKSPEDAQKVAGGVGDAALVMVANTLLNLDETITKG